MPALPCVALARLELMGKLSSGRLTCIGCYKGQKVRTGDKEISHYLADEGGHVMCSQSHTVIKVKLEPGLVSPLVSLLDQRRVLVERVRGLSCFPSA